MGCLWIVFVLLSIASQFELFHGQETDNAPEDCTPQEVHLSMGATASEVVVMWSTAGSQCVTEVKFSTDPWNLANVANGQSRPSHSISGNFLHRVLLQNLQSGATYYYRPAKLDRTSPFMFKASDTTKPSKLMVLSGSLSPEVLSTIKKEERTGAYTALLYTNVPDLHSPQEEKFVSQLSDAATSLPVVTTGLSNSWSRTFSDYLRQLPTSDSPWPNKDQQLWYSLDIGPIHFISYSTEVFFLNKPDLAKAQQEWLVKDLMATNQTRDQTPWIVAMGNQPMYCWSPSGDLDCSSNTSHVRHGLEDVFYHFAVDLVLASVPGSYQRNYPQYKGVLVSKSYSQPSTPVEVIMPASEVVTTPSAVNNDTQDEADAAVPEWSAYHTDQSSGQSYGVLTVVNSSHLHWQLVSVQTSSVLDEIWLQQDQHGNFSLASLPHNISHEINRTIIAMGGKPGTYDFIGGTETGQSGNLEGLSKYSLWIGLASVACVLLLVLGLATLKSCLRHRKGRSGRRWQEIDKENKFYSVASDSDTDDNDFEINVYDKTNKQSSKLLTSY